MWRERTRCDAAANVVAVVVQRGLALLVHVLLEHVLVEDHLGDVLLEQGLVLPLLSSLKTNRIF